LLIYLNDHIFLTINRFPMFHPLLTNVPEVCSSVWTLVSSAAHITGVCDDIFSFKVRVVSYVFRYADFGKNTQKFWHVQL